VEDRGATGGGRGFGAITSTGSHKITSRPCPLSTAPAPLCWRSGRVSLEAAAPRSRGSPHLGANARPGTRTTAPSRLRPRPTRGRPLPTVPASRAPAYWASMIAPYEAKRPNERMRASTRLQVASTRYTVHRPSRRFSSIIHFRGPSVLRTFTVAIPSALRLGVGCCSTSLKAYGGKAVKRTPPNNTKE
jgi:hypothetical protein